MVLSVVIDRIVLELFIKILGHFKHCSEKETELTSVAKSIIAKIIISTVRYAQKIDL